MDAIGIITYILAAVFIVLTVLLVFAYRRTGHHGLLLMAFCYGGGAGLAIVLSHWWPLLAGFVLAWLMKLLGLDPGINIHPADARGTQVPTKNDEK